VTQKTVNFVLVAMILMMSFSIAVLIENIVVHRRDVCDRLDKTAAVMHGMIVIAYTPPKGSHLSAQQQRYIGVVEGNEFALINTVRC
jgi:hypothetical protein